MNKVILNGVDISKSVNIVEKVKEFINQVEQVEKIHRQKGRYHSEDDNEIAAEWHFGYATSCLATINDLRNIIQGERKWVKN